MDSERLICLDCEALFKRERGSGFYRPCPECGCPSVVEQKAYDYNPSPAEPLPYLEARQLRATRKALKDNLDA